MALAQSGGRTTAAALLATVLFSAAAPAVDKNGVAPRAISLPSGPGSIQGLGESFQPQFNTGSGSFAVPLLLPSGTAKQTPKLALAYDSGAANGSLGLGWSLSGLPSIRRNTDHGVPYYTDGPDGLDNDGDGASDNPEELDTFTGMNGEELVPLADGSFRAENETAFIRYVRSGGGWEARTPDGDRLLFGISAAARIEDGGRTFAWCLEREVDLNGNAIDYEYLADPATPAQKFVRRIRWGQPAAFFAVLFRYQEGRPDITSNFQPHFELRTSLRLVGIDVFSTGIPGPAFAERADFDGDGRGDRLIRRFRLEYDPDSHLSLLTRVTQLGADGVTTRPSLSLGYSRSPPPDQVDVTVIRSRDAPPAAFESPSVELIDMNADALPDLLSTAGSQHRVFLNRGVDAQGRLAWAPSQPVGEAPSIDISSDRTHLADATSDGLSDLMVKVTNTSFLCFDNTSRIAWTANPFPILNTDTWPIWPHDGAAGAQSRSFDSDYSRSNDVFHTSLTGNQLWLLLPGGRYSRELRFPPLSVDGQTFRFDLPGTHIADLNGDRLQDLAWIQGTRVVYFPNRGRGDFAAPVVLLLGRTLVAADIDRADFSDIDGDGLVDLTVVRPSFQPGDVVYWLNRFQRGLEGPRSVGGLPAQRAGDALRWADMNGNGTTDIAITQVQSAVGEKILVVDLVPAGKNFLLSRIENGLGLRVDLEYESSTAQMVRATAAGTPWSTVMPIAVTVVSRIAEDDGRGHVFAQTVTYRDPFYEPDKQEFRGFRSAEAAEAGDASIDGKLARMVFDTGFEAACLKGKLLGEEVLGEDGRLYQRSVHSWGQRALAAGLDGREVCFAFQAATDQFIHEGQPVGIHLRKETDYDDFGNAVGERNHGVFEVAGDELFIERTFEVRPAAWLLRLVKTATQRDGAGNLLDDREFFHDATGNLERIEAWLDTEDRWFPVLRQRLDAFGNVTEATDARGLRRTIGFDALLHALPVSETLHLESRELAMSAEYDLGFGVVTGAVDFHGQTTSYLYDALGRLVEIRRPGGAGELFEYTFGNPVSRVAKRLRLEGGATFDSFLYSDGLGRPLGSWLAAEDGRWRVVEAKSYNARKLEAHLWLPYTAESPDYSEPDPALPHEARSYDALGRLTEGLRPDGSIVRQERQPLGVAVSDGNDTAGGGTPDLRRYDGLERLRSVEEHNGAETYLTTYSYRATGELEAIVDALGNTRRFRFDSLGRLIEMDDPDRGVRRQVHDDVGNLVEREDARGQVTRWRYDAANRILERDYVGLTIGGTDPKDAVYHYDAPVGLLDFGDGTQGSARNVLGRLAWVEDATGEEHISYDERGNVEWVLKRVRDPRTGVLVPYRTQESHDLLNRETETIFPDNDRLRVERNAGGFVERLDGGPQGLVVLAGADYAPNGQPLRLRFGNAAESVFTYDRSQRLASLRALDAAGAALLDDAITYDLAANVTAIVDQRPLAAVPAGSPRRRSASFDYDELNRLTRVSYGAAGELGRIDYTYDALGNLLAQSTPPAGAPGHIVDPAVDLGDLSYAGGRSGRDGRGAADPPGPHAVTGTERGHRFAYDASGNVTAYAGASLNWDFEDRLSRFAKPGLEADYLHDHSQRRVSKLLVRNQAPEETLYLDQAFEVENGAPIKYALLDGRRLARITGVLDPTRERVQRLVLATGWNLIAAAVASPARLRDVFGADAAVYEARGASYGALDTSTVVPVARALWVHVPAARLAALRGPVPASAGGDSPGPLHAWPRLEGFAPALHVAGGAPLLVYEARERRWLRRDPSLPSFLSRAPADLGAARAFWSNGAVSLNPSAAAATAAVTYHQDHLGTPAALTDATGMLLEERAQYPYGALRSRHRPVGAEAIAAGAGGRWDFTGKERDAESDLVDMGARAYLDLAGIFLSPDPRYAEVALLGSGGSRDEASFTAFLHNPQMGNLYAYGTRNPLKYVDPSGLEVVFSPALQKNPVFQEALALFKSTKEGQRLLKHLSESKAVIRVNEGRAISGGKENLGSATREYNGRLEINVDRHKKFFTDKERLIFELADTIHHELRHAEGNVNTRELAQARGILDAAMGAAKQMKLPQGTIPPILRQGTEVHDALDKTKDDPLNREFRRQAQNQQVKQFLLNHPDPKYRAAGADMVTD